MSDISKWADIPTNCNFLPETELQVLKMVSVIDSDAGHELDYDDSRKRHIDPGLDTELIKKSHNLGANGMFHLKILVPSVAAGAIIGKGGETIAQLQKEAGARVKMSKATDYYPGTTERVCLISGSYEGILHIHNFIMEKVKEKPDPNAKMAIDFDHKQPAEREKQVKILVPNSTAGMIMGKGGNYIKQIKETSGAYVQISQKSKDYALAERCITVIGEMDNNRKACAMILAKIIEDPQSGSCLNVSYADVTGPVPNFNPTGSPFANPNSVPNGIVKNSSTSFSSSSSLNSLSPNISSSLHTPQGEPNRSPGITLFPEMGFNSTPIHPSDATQVIESTKAILRGNGYTEVAVTEITNAMSTLASYGILGLRFDASAVNDVPVVGNLGLALHNSASNCPMPGGGITNLGMFATGGGIHGMEAMANPALPPSTTMGGGSNMFNPITNFNNGMSNYGPGYTTSTPARSGNRYMMQQEGAMFDSFQQRNSPTLASPSAAALPVNNNSFGLGTSLSPTSGAMKSPTSERQCLDVTTEFEVNENIIGAILGPHGKSLAEIQRISGSNVQISQKGGYSSGGARSRIITITGSPRAVDTAQYLIQQQITTEETGAPQHALGALH